MVRDLITLTVTPLTVLVRCTSAEEVLGHGVEVGG